MAGTEYDIDNNAVIPFLYQATLEKTAAIHVKPYENAPAATIAMTNLRSYYLSDDFNQKIWRQWSLS